jgi:hypothetical protein
MYIYFIEIMSSSKDMHKINGVCIVGNSRLFVCFNSEINKQIYINSLFRRQSASKIVEPSLIVYRIRFNATFMSVANLV